MLRGKEILDFIRSRPGGASTEEIAGGLEIRPRSAGKIIRDLELAGEVFRCNGRWMNTAATIGLDLALIRKSELLSLNRNGNSSLRGRSTREHHRKKWENIREAY